MATLASKCSSSQAIAESRIDKNKSQLNELRDVYSLDSSFNCPSTTESHYNPRDFQKSPFLPRLPKKSVMSRLNQTHLINDFYIEPNLTKEENRLKSSRKLKVDFKGDLLKASQVYYALNSNMSASMKHAKTSDTPWGSNSKNSAKPCKSAISKSRVETATFMRRSASRLNLSSGQSNRTNSSLNSEPRYKAYALKIQQNSTQNSNKIFNQLEKTPVKIQKFAEDLLIDHFKKSLLTINEFLDSNENKNLNEAFVRATDPDVALHVFNNIWEFHSFALKNSPYLTETLQYQQSLPETSEIKTRIQESKEITRTNIGKEYLDKMSHLYLEINEPLIDKHSLAVALGNLYLPETIEVPSKLAGGVLAAAHLLKFDALKIAAIDKMSTSLSAKTIVYYYTSAVKFKETRAIELCEKWLEMNLVPVLGNSIYLRDIPLKLLTKTLKSNRFFTVTEYNNFMTIINWTFLNINRQIKELPTESMIITYFSSFGKEKTLLERYPDLKDALFSIRLHGITKSNSMNTIQQMNIFPPAYIVKIMMEIQNSLTHGGDMSINRVFDTSAIRQGFVIETEQNFHSEVFSLYGFHFELIAERIKREDSSKDSFQFYIQRLSTNDPVLTYEQSQLETFSLRNDRYCNYSINVLYWYNGNQEYLTTGMRKHRFGKAKTQTTPSFEVDIPVLGQNDDQLPPAELYVQYSFIFPTD